MKYHLPAQLTTPGPTPWWLAPVDEPQGGDPEVVSQLVRSLQNALRDLDGAVRLGFLHAVNAVGRLARNRTRRGWVQVTNSYVVAGAGVGLGTARKAIRRLCRTLLCTRDARGYMTTVPEAVAACLRVVDQVGAPRPEVQGDLWSGPQVDIMIPEGKARGKTRCPCGEHAHGDRDPSLAFDLRRGLATCQKTRAVYRLGDDGAWRQVRRPWPDQRSVDEVGAVGVARSTAVMGRVHNTYLGGAPAQPGRAQRDPDTPLPWERPEWWGGPWSPWGRHLNATLSPGRLRRSFAGDDWKLPRTIPQIMRWCEAHYGGDRQRVAAEDCATCGVDRAHRLVSLERYVLDPDATCWQERRDGSFFPRVPVYKAAGTEHVVIDLDNLIDRDTDPDPDTADAICSALAGTDLEPVSIVATSRTGLQVIARLPGWCPDTSALYRDPRVLRMLGQAGEMVREAVGRGGKVDPACWAPGRLVRRPGWRTKGGEAVRARLWWAAED